MTQQIFNNEFRDMTAEASYPFSGRSSLQTPEIIIDSGLFLDAVIYPVLDNTAPYFISELTNLTSNHEVKVTITDAVLREVGTALCPSDTDSAIVLDRYSRPVGVLVYDQVKMDIFRGKVANRTLEFDRDIMEFAGGLCYNLPVDGTLYVRSGDDQFTDDMVLSAANGIHFELTDDPDPTIRVNLYGEERVTTIPIKRIASKNDPGMTPVDEEHVWLAAAPDSEIRVQTADRINIGKARDFGYGT